MNLPVKRKSKTLSSEVYESLSQRIRSGHFNAGEKLPTEADLMIAYEVSRTVIREALSQLQASGLVETKHGIGTFVRELVEPLPFTISSEQVLQVRDTIALLELRLALETEIAALAASRRSEHQLQEMSRCLSALNEAIEAGQDMISADFDFHLSLATATENHHFVDLMKLLGPGAIPRARLGLQDTMDPSARQQYLRRVQSEHESIFLAIKNQDVDAARAAMRTHLANSRERLRRVWEQAS